MRIAVLYSFNGGESFISANHPTELQEVYEVIAKVDATQHKTKTSREKTMAGRSLYNPRTLNAAFTGEFKSRGWTKHKIECVYSTKYYVDGFRPDKPPKGAFREMDFVKNLVGVEVQFGKYAFMVYNVCAKMTIFRNSRVINAVIEIVPVKSFAEEMSCGVSYFEQIVWDLENRGIADIDVSVLILGVTA